MSNSEQKGAVIETEALIIGAGPVGLFQVFELGLLGIRAHVIEALGQPGGQCSELYPDKPIYDIPACPAISAQQLTDRLLEQIAPFAATFHFNQQADSLERLADDRLRVRTAQGLEFVTRSIIIAAGMGAFQPVKLKLEGVEALVDHSVHYKVQDRERFRGKDIVVLGGGDSALDWALELQTLANSVVLVHRSDQFRAAPASVAELQRRCEALEMQFLPGQVTGFTAADTHLQRLQVTGKDGVTRSVDLDELLVFFGLSPQLGGIEHWGLDTEKRQIRVDTEKFATSVPGIYAVGDINTYPGKKKLILSGFHEAALAAFAIKEQLDPGRKVHLQYTTTSPVMHQRLKVDDPYEDKAEDAA